MTILLGVVMTMRLERVSYSLELVSGIVPLMRILADVIPKGLREVVVLRHEVVLEMVDQEG